MRVRFTESAARNLALLLLQSGQPVESAAVYREVLERDPHDGASAQALAWLLATHPDDRTRQGAEARQLAERLVRSTAAPTGQQQMTLAAALAECGEFEAAADAARAAERAFQGSGEATQARIMREQFLPILQRRLPIRDPQLQHPLGQ